MTKEEIKSIEMAMLNEHRKDLEALDRLKRFLPDSAPNGTGNHETADEEDESDSGASSLRDKIAEIMSAAPDQNWTGQKVLARLIELKFPLASKKPINGVSVALNIWVKRGKAHIHKKGSGRKPNIYRWGPKVSPPSLFSTIKEATGKTQ
jgi:hypothetical protein